jgi:hypothetical protein
LASRRIARTKSFSAYLSSINDEVANLKSRADTTGRSIEDGAISGTTLADEVSLVSNGISSSNYIPNYSGWRISGSGVAEFSNVFVRGDINAYSGTIGYWNISSPSVTRSFGDTTLFGTFLESSDVGDSDANKTDGTYVGLFKSYTLEPNLILSKYRKDNIATITTPGHGFLVGDRVYVSVTDDTSFSSIAAPVSVIAITGDTISYINEGDDFTNLDASDEPVDNTAEGTVTLYNPDVAGLYLRDYSKREFDYGYFSNTGISYVSAEDVNVIENPSFEYINSSIVLTPDHTTSWTAGAGLTYGVETFSTPSAYKNSSSYGGSLTWTTALSTYLSSTIDFAAGSSYRAFGLGRSLHFGATVFPKYVPPITKLVSLVETHTLSNSFTSATANTTTITYTGSGLTLSAGQYITVTGYANSRFNITAQKIATATATTVTVTLTGDAVATETATRTATSQLLKITTSTSHGFAAGDTVFLDMDVVYENLDFGGDITSVYSPHTIADGTQGYTFTVSASPAPSGSIVYLSTEFSTMEADGTDLTRVPHSSRALNIFKVYETALDLSAITISYPNVGTTTPITDVLSAETSALWAAGIDKYLIGTANSYMLGYLDSGIGISALTNPNGVLLDGASIDAAYQAADPVGYAAKTDIKLNIPGWLLLHDGNGVVPTSPTKISFSSLSGYIIDDVYLSTASNFFYGSELDTNRWYEDTEDLIPARASVEGTKTWLNIDVENQSASLDYFDYIGFRNNTFSKTMLVRPSLGVYDSTETYLKFPDSTYETTTLTGGQYQYLTPTQYINVSPSLKLIAGDRSASFELAASTKLIDLITGESSISQSAVIAGLYNEESNTGTIYVGSDKFVWTQYPSTLDNEADASVIFTADLASFAQRIRTTSSISALLGITTSAGFTGNNIRLNSTAAYSLITTNHPFQIGFNSSDNLRMDRDGIQAVSNEAVSTLNINTFGGTINAGSSTSTFTVNGYLRVESTNDVSLGSTNHSFQIGSNSGINLRMDNNEIQGVNNGAANTINIQASGGNTVIGAGGGDVTIGNSTSTGTLILGSTTGTPGTQFFYRWAATSSIGSASTLSVASSGLVGRATSSRRFKQNVENLSVDVLSVLSVMPKKFKYTTDIEQYGDNAPVAYGFIAEELHELGLTEFVDYDELGDPFSIEYSKYVVALQAVVKHQASQIQSLSDRLDALEGN